MSCARKRWVNRQGTGKRTTSQAQSEESRRGAKGGLQAPASIHVAMGWEPLSATPHGTRMPHTSVFLWVMHWPRKEVQQKAPSPPFLPSPPLAETPHRTVRDAHSTAAVVRVSLALAPPARHSAVSGSSLPPAVVAVLLCCSVAFEGRDFVLLTSRAEACAVAFGEGYCFV